MIIIMIIIIIIVISIVISIIIIIIIIIIVVILTIIIIIIIINMYIIYLACIYRPACGRVRRKRRLSDVSARKPAVFLVRGILDERHTCPTGKVLLLLLS